jgi:4-hydroxy-2-oxoheptanedioate aldolase
MPAPVGLPKQGHQAGLPQSRIRLDRAERCPAEIAAPAEVDWPLIDGEHAPNLIRSLSALLAVTGGRGEQAR